MDVDAGDPLSDEQLKELLDELHELRGALLEAEYSRRDELDAVDPSMRAHARNLLHYVAFRQFDLRPLQARLARAGLSSLGRSEGRTLDAIDSVMRVIERMLGLSLDRPPQTPPERVREALCSETQRLLGSREGCAIMVTLPTEAAHDDALVRDLLTAGMQIARINCAHDDRDTWVAAVERIERMRRELDRPCRILFDLPGPKLRTLHVKGDGAIPLCRGDTLLLTAGGEAGRPARYDDDGQLVAPARISCALPALIDALEVGAPVHFDDGKISCEVTELRDGAAKLEVVSTSKPCDKLRGEKGINVPETHIDVPALGEDDLAALEVAVGHADLVGLSFARTREDVQQLHRELDRLSAHHLGVVLKIETRQGFEQLPAMLLEAMRRPPLGVMIARGDLAVECGFERLAELQEEILWVCEAARVPAIWATQVLERLAKKGRVTRAEITDAAMAERAECVMLNKGSHIVQAVKTLSDVLARMRGHQHKKTALLRPLRSLRLS